MTLARDAGRQYKHVKAGNDDVEIVFIPKVKFNGILYEKVFLRLNKSCLLLLFSSGQYDTGFCLFNCFFSRTCAETGIILVV